MDIAGYSINRLVGLLKEYLSKRKLDSIPVEITKYEWFNGRINTQIERSVVKIPNENMNPVLNANTLVIYGLRNRQDIKAHYHPIPPTIVIFYVDDSRQDEKKIYTLYTIDDLNNALSEIIKTENDMDQALEEIIAANPPQNTPQTTQNSGHQDITNILRRILSLVERIDKNTHPATFQPSRDGM